MLLSDIIDIEHRIHRAVNFRTAPVREGWSLSCAPRVKAAIITAIMSYYGVDEQRARTMFREFPVVYVSNDETSAREDLHVDAELGRLTGLVTPIGKVWHAPLTHNMTADDFRRTVQNGPLPDNLSLYTSKWAGSKLHLAIDYFF